MYFHFGEIGGIFPVKIDKIKCIRTVYTPGFTKQILRKTKQNIKTISDFGRMTMMFSDPVGY